MSENTKIEWTDQTWNPMIGCSKISDGCRNCYAMHVAHVRAGNPALASKFGGTTKREGGKTVWTGAVNLSEEALLLPLSWNRPRRIFVNSMSDLFHPAVPDEWIDKVFAIMALAPQHTFQVLTKRPERLHGYMDLRTDNREHEIGAAMLVLSRGKDAGCPELPLQNVWLGVSVEDQRTADERIPLLLQTPSAVRFVSAEPLLGPVNLNRIDCGDGSAAAVPCTKRLKALPSRERRGAASQRLADSDNGPRLDWVIVGGESGPAARPCDLTWIGDVVRQCAAARRPVFVKQLGAKAVNTRHGECAGCIDPDWAGATHCEGTSQHPQGLGLHDRKGGDPEEWPHEVRMREFPASPALE